MTIIKKIIFKSAGIIIGFPIGLLMAFLVINFIENLR